MNNIAKLLAPNAKNILRRPRIVTALGRMLDRGSLWLAAPAGFGKSSAIADYVGRSGRPFLWYRVDPGDNDVASFFHYLARSLPPDLRTPALPRFGAEYADQPLDFARRFFRSFFARLPAGTTLVLDDIHDAPAAAFTDLLPVLLRETPDPARCIFISRTLPPTALGECMVRGELSVIEQDVLRFTEAEARTLLQSRLGDAASSTDISPARGWAAGLVLLSGHASSPDATRDLPQDGARALLHDTLARQFLDSHSDHEKRMILKISLLPEITPRLARDVTAADDSESLIRGLYKRQLLIRIGGRGEPVYQLHDLLRDLLAVEFSQRFSPEEQAALRIRASEVLTSAGRHDDAVELALAAEAWSEAAGLIDKRAPSLLAEGRRATLLNWCRQLPEERLGGWLCYWLAVASLPDDVAAEKWLTRAWQRLEREGDVRGLCLTAARAVLVKTDSWRTHHGLATWTQRALGLIDRLPADLPPDDALLTLVGMLHASDFAEELDVALGGRIAAQILQRLSDPSSSHDPDLALLASAAVIEHAGSFAKAGMFEQAVDSVADLLGKDSASPWVLGLWLVSFGSVCGRYFSYARRGFPYPDAEQALRAAIGIGEREGLRSVEFGGLYHLQLQLKLRNELDEFGGLVTRLARIADSRNSTQVAVAADCRAALHTLSGNVAEAYRDCDRFMAAIEEAGEPPIERWPHFITRFQVLLADRKGDEAAAWLGGLIDMFDGAVRDRTSCCMKVAEALAAKWRADGDYPSKLAETVTLLRASGWTSILANLPEMLSELLADALQHGFEMDFCRQLIATRRLNPPAERPSAWPWPLRIHVLGQFRVELDGEPLRLGPKTPARSLDLLRALAAARDHIVPLAELHDSLWPDAEGDQAKSACDQALHRLRKLLGRADLLIQRDGKLSLAPEHCWVDLDEWEHRLAASEIVHARRALEEFPGPLLPHEGDHPLWTHAAHRVRRAYRDLAFRLDRTSPAEADAIRSRLMTHYPEDAFVSA